MKFSHAKLLAIVLFSSHLFSSHAMADDSNLKTILGGGIGAAAGTALGGVVGGRTGEVVGGAVGGGLGGAVSTRGEGQTGAMIGGAAGGAGFHLGRLGAADVIGPPLGIGHLGTGQGQ